MSAGVEQIGQRFAANVRRHRKAAGLSQEVLSFMAGIHRTQISLLETGGRLPRFITFLKLRGAPRATADALMEGIEFEPHVVQSGGFQVSDPEERQ